jgi:hypothetical protein
MKRLDIVGVAIRTHHDEAGCRWREIAIVVPEGANKLDMAQPLFYP